MQFNRDRDPFEDETMYTTALLSSGDLQISEDMGDVKERLSRIEADLANIRPTIRDMLNLQEQGAGGSLTNPNSPNAIFLRTTMQEVYKYIHQQSDTIWRQTDQAIDGVYDRLLPKIDELKFRQNSYDGLMDDIERFRRESQRVFGDLDNAREDTNFVGRPYTMDEPAAWQAPSGGSRNRARSAQQSRRRRRTRKKRSRRKSRSRRKKTRK